MNTQAEIQILHYEETGWISISCHRCNHIIWQGEFRWWIEAQITSARLLTFLLGHTCK